jgi:hypothetical protein
MTMQRSLSLLAAFWLVAALYALAAAETETKQETRMNISINGQQFATELANNDTATAFAALAPMKIKMDDLHGNEKYHYLATHLPSRPEKPGQIHAGDLMLFGDSCVVLFYRDFSTSYSYTRIGRLKNAGGLARTLGTGAVTVEFSLEAREQKTMR